MRIEVYSRGGEVGFTIHAETETDLAVLGMVTSQSYQEGRELALLGSTYSCDVSATTAMTLGWRKVSEDRARLPLERLERLEKAVAHLCQDRSSGI